MSTRYVWSRSELKISTLYTYNARNGSALYISIEDGAYWSWTTAGTGMELVGGPVYFTWGTSYSIANGAFQINNSTMVTVNTGDRYGSSNQRRASVDLGEVQAISSYTDIYFGFSSSRTNSFTRLYHAHFRVSSPEDDSTVRLDYLYFPGADYVTPNSFHVWDSPITFSFQGEGYVYEVSQGTANGTVSNASSGAYPADGVSGNYWYTLSGSDNIDASAVGYNTQTPMGGQAITINVTPGTGNVYGGTVRYTYQVQLSGGSWQTIASNQTATSRSYTIPAGTTTFAARVLASDTWGFSSSTYTTGATISVTNNLPPTAPGSISVGSIVAGQAVTITLTAATDSDGTIASYIYERSIDGNGWTQIANVNALTYQDTVGQEWATVAYRAKAVDDDGASGPYVTGTTYTVNDGVLYISGPEVEMGTMVKPFTANMSVGVTGNAATDVAFYVYVDGRCLHDTPVDTGESVPIAIDTRLLSTGDHIITATASKTGYVQASAAYHFETEIAALAGEGYVEQLRDYQGNPIFPRVVAAGIEGINTPTAATVTLTTSGWIQSGTRYAQTVTVEAVTVETAVVIADCALSDDADANASIIEAWGPVMSYPITQGSSTLTFYVDSVPSINIPVNVGVM